VGKAKLAMKFYWNSTAW